MTDVTRILDAAAAGDPQAASQLLPFVYDELRLLASAKLAREKPGQTLDATALVHEAYLKLIGPNSARAWKDRLHFFAVAAEAMRRILVDRARSRHAERHGGGFARQPVELDQLAASESSPDLIALDDALSKLAGVAPRAAEVVKLRYFAGLTVPQAAAALDIAPRTADADWAYAKAWLFAELRDDNQ